MIPQFQKNEDDGYCQEGLVINSTGKLSELETYSLDDSIKLTGVYNFLACDDTGRQIFKNSESATDVFFYYSKDGYWSVSNKFLNI